MTANSFRVAAAAFAGRQRKTTTTPTRLALVLFALSAGACDAVSPSDESGNLVPLTVVENRSLPAIEMNGSRFHAETFGNPANPVIVMLHGGPGGDYRSMIPLAARHNGYSLTDDYFLVFWDQRGSGLSQRHDREALTTDVFVDDLSALLNRYSPGRPAYLIGISWGAMLGTEFINRFPQRVAGAVLIESGPLDGAIMERLEDEIIDLNLRSEWVNDWAWNTQFFTPDGHARMDYERMLGSQDSQPRYGLSKTNPEPVWRLGAAASRYVTEAGQNEDGVFDYDFTTNLSSFKTPVLFIAGSASEVQGESLQREQIGRYPSATLEVVSGAGHDVAWIKTAEVVSHIRTYLNARKGGLR